MDAVGNYKPSVFETVLANTLRQSNVVTSAFNTQGAKSLQVILQSILNGADALGTNSTSGSWSSAPPTGAGNASHDYDQSTSISGTFSQNIATVYYIIDYGSTATRVPYATVYMSGGASLGSGGSFTLDYSSNGSSWTNLDSAGCFGAPYTFVTRYLNQALTSVSCRYMRVGFSFSDPNQTVAMTGYIYELEDRNLAGGTGTVTLEIQDPVSSVWIPYTPANSLLPTITCVGSSGVNPTAQTISNLQGETYNTIIPYDSTKVRLKLTSLGGTNISITVVKTF